MYINSQAINNQAYCPISEEHTDTIKRSFHQNFQDSSPPQPPLTPLFLHPYEPEHNLSLICNLPRQSGSHRLYWLSTSSNSNNIKDHTPTHKKKKLTSGMHSVLNTT